MSLIQKPTQCQKILEVLEKNENEWVNGRYFCQTMFLSQAHARIWELRNLRSKYKYVGNIITSEFRDEYGFISYKLEVN